MTVNMKAPVVVRSASPQVDYRLQFAVVERVPASRALHHLREPHLEPVRLVSVQVVRVCRLVVADRAHVDRRAALWVLILDRDWSNVDAQGH